MKIDPKTWTWQPASKITARNWKKKIHNGHPDRADNMIVCPICHVRSQNMVAHVHDCPNMARS